MLRAWRWVGGRLGGGFTPKSKRGDSSAGHHGTQTMEMKQPGPISQTATETEQRALPGQRPRGGRTHVPTDLLWTPLLEL